MLPVTNFLKPKGRDLGWDLGTFSEFVDNECSFLQPSFSTPYYCYLGLDDALWRGGVSYLLEDVWQHPWLLPSQCP